MPRKPKLDATQAQGEAAAPPADTQVVEVFADLPSPDVEEDTNLNPLGLDIYVDADGNEYYGTPGYSEADNPSNGWQAPDGAEADSDPGAGPEDYDTSGYGDPANLPEGWVSEPPTPDVDPGATDPPPVSVNAADAPPTEAAPVLTEAEAQQALKAAEATAHLVRLNAMTRGELMAYAADELGVKVRDTNPKPKIIDTIMGVLVKDHVPGSITASAVAHRTVGGGAARPSKPKVPQAKLIALGLACPGCGTFLAQEDGRTTWTIGTDFLPDVHTCACGVTMQTPKELHAVPTPAPAVSPTPPEPAVSPAAPPPPAVGAPPPPAAAA